jgi:16S rRNA (adenine1518-N6/adenine1519-N6)-dimethyltransferase
MRGQRRSAPPRARRRFGQHFLVDEAILRKVVEAFGPRSGEAILEIGPGRGALTAEILRSVERIAAVEIDRDLAALLRGRFGPGRLVLLEENVLTLPLAAIAPALGFAPATRLAVVGNLPYNVSKPIALKLVEERSSVGRSILMFQREVADRLTARPGSKAYGPLTLLVGFAYEVSRLFDVPPRAFRPRPEVHSTVTSWVTRPERQSSAIMATPIKACLAACFAHRRRTLANNLRAALPGGEEQSRQLLNDTGLDGSLRAEQLQPEAFVELAARWPRAAQSG